MNSDLSHIRILVVMPSIPIFGMERANLQIMKMLRNMNAEILFVTDRDYGERVRTEVENIGCKWANIVPGQRIRIPKNPIKLIRVIGDIVKASKSINQIYKEFKPTHIHITDLSSFVRSFITILNTKKKVIFRLPNPPDNEIKGYKGFIYKLFWIYFIGKFSDVLVCNSKYTAKELRNIGVKHKDIRVIYNCIPERNIEKRNTFNFINEYNFNVVYIGRISENKGVNILYKAAKRLIHEFDDIYFYLAGDYNSNNEFAANLQKQIAYDNLEKKFNLLGEIEDVFSLLSKCHLHVCPTKSEEPFGIVVLEAKKHHIPSVVFPSGGLLEIVTHLKDGYVCKNKTVDQLSKAIKYYKDNNKELMISGAEANRSLEKFDHKKIFNKWEEVYN